MKRSFCDSPYPNIEKVAMYLEKGEVTYVTASFGKDVFTGEKIPVQITGMTDGKYSWNSVLPYYVRKYNLKLPEEFEAYIE